MKRIATIVFMLALVAPSLVAAAPSKKAKPAVAPIPLEEPAEIAPPNDLFEPINRVTFAVNDGIDLIIVNPLVALWNGLMPSFVRTGVGNFFNNLDDVYVGVNHLLQGNGSRAGVDFERVAVNSTVGIGGLIDVGAKMGLQKVDGDFGQTLGVWGLPTGPYVILPLIGPSTVRESAGRSVRVMTDPRTYLDAVPSYSLMGLEYLQTRADAKANEGLIAASSLDRYVFIRNLYLQKRSLMVKSGQTQH
ncbi:MAG: VacJ family lipoprotein [Alphaproteobacteria bacterium]|jgi:phospholipid-binding lipoprotein MlaA|nr:VacJ family lipoprotein [Beijerinckiaceae bacterium]NBQ40569.1 VacJ family lipoprotein [Alphaproteobacteria bacterium]